MKLLDRIRQRKEDHLRAEARLGNMELVAESLERRVRRLELDSDVFRQNAHNYLSKAS